jgi:hypothetical protein
MILAFPQYMTQDVGIEARPWTVLVVLEVVDPPPIRAHVQLVGLSGSQDGL